MRVFTIDEPVFKVEPLFVLGCDHDRLVAYLRRRFRLVITGAEGIDASASDTLCGRMYTFGVPPWRVVWTKTLDIGPALHECLHLVTRICADRGIVIRAHDEHGNCADKPAAYLFEFFASRMVRRMGYRR